ncbi:MAG: DUF3800 domain-containing protein [Spirochaetota bacterium]|jgi:hypothetical protein
MKWYFVDESGDGVIFSKKGKVLTGSPGTGNYFILGMADVELPDELGRKLNDLRDSLLKDPYFKDIPSMRPDQNKTALFFHAKDDIPEVRREVYKIIAEHEIRFSAEIRDMKVVLDYVISRNMSDPEYRYHPDELYDSMVRRLFKERLHKEDEYRIVFSRRGKSDRTRALAENLGKARSRFKNQHGIETDSRIEIVSAYSHEHGGLQAIDYFLWALKRMFENNEDRFLQYLWPGVSLIHDIDDTRENRYGRYYNKKRPLTKEVLSGRCRI